MPRQVISQDGSTLVQMAVVVPEEVRRQIKVIAAETGRTMPEVFTEAVAQYIEQRKKH